jgi:hypothetical protein
MCYLPFSLTYVYNIPLNDEITKRIPSRWLNLSNRNRSNVAYLSKDWKLHGAVFHAYLRSNNYHAIMQLLITGDAAIN